MNSRKYIVTSVPFADWDERLNKMLNGDDLLPNLTYVKKLEDVNCDSATALIVLNPKQYINSSYREALILNSNNDVITTLSNKCLFAKFMMENFADFVPKTIHINLPNYSYVDSDYLSDRKNGKSRKMIVKPARGAGGRGISIVHEIPNTKDHIVVSDYVEHTEHYAGHMIINRGKILKQIYFRENTDGTSEFIKRGRTLNYVELETHDMINELNVNLSIFENIFKHLDYSGFVCIDFIIKDRKPIIFEINPRPGGSLIHNERRCLEFFKTIISNGL
ncbi:ATP-grasp domain protein [Yasminevirus sp. GU-2018]|uniref:ATP-grasp domain protein n=1 Tax=Yasminevirus sp. GU-2018 TaxID=2420051 RepID=A0A5K0U7I8_9VIRU|nr:ATP-grasp domain protein [Yasminevirus sp. GU-2018]